MSNPVVEEYHNTLAELEEASGLIRNVAAQAYVAPPSDNDINLYNKLTHAISKIAKDKLIGFETLIKSVEPNIEKLNDLSQKLIISNILIQHLYMLKDTRPEINVLPIIMLIPYWMDNESWLKCIIEETMPYLVNLDLI